MKRLLDYDPLSGISTYHYYDSLTDETTIYEEANLEPLWESNYKLRNDDDLTKKGIKAGNWLYARIHPLEQTKFLRKYGYNVFDKTRYKETMKILNSDPEFQLCKTTRGRHA